MIKLLTPADIISMMNAGFGFFAILFLLMDTIDSSRAFRLSFSCILLALIADGLDGIIARRTKKGVLGEYFEAMADMTSLGIAPAFFIFIYFQNQVLYPSIGHVIGTIGILILYLCCSIIRLASFHHLKTEEHFIGLPASAATILIITPSFLELHIIFVQIIMVIVSIMMISHIPYPKPKIQLNALAAILIMLSAIVEKQVFGIFPIMLLIIIILYVIIGPITILKGKYIKKS